ncbi:MAG: PEP-CTERM sorting domain-containing protein [Verrucomicrobiae bacterium]|nr:PEP-CTERM sorting domain-containing protein [Verrucomicrobiae bacterium]
MKKFLKSLAVLGVMLSVGNAVANFTGDPVADGWKFHGNSLDLGIFARDAGGALYSFDVYSHSFTLSEDDELVDDVYWKPGDQIYGVGGVNLSGYINRVRIVAKFGASDAIFSPSTYVGSPGDGKSDFSDGDGGIGSVLVGYEYKFDGDQLNPMVFGQNGGIVTPDIVQYYDGTTPVLNIDVVYAYARGIFQTEGIAPTEDTNADPILRDVLQSFEIIVNLTALADPLRDGVNETGFDPIPALGGLAVVVIQEHTYARYTDALIPEPSTGVLVFLAATGLLAIRRRG